MFDSAESLKGMVIAAGFEEKDVVVELKEPACVIIKAKKRGMVTEVVEEEKDGVVTATIIEDVEGRKGEDETENWEVEI